MSAIAKFTGPKAEILSSKYLEKLKELGIFGLQTLDINGNVIVCDVQKVGLFQAAVKTTTVELPTHLAEHHQALLAAITAEESNVFGTADTVVKTLGSVQGNVF